MSTTVSIAKDLYTKPALNALGGARWSFRKMSLATTDLISTQLVAINWLPAGHRLMDFFLESGSLDSAAATLQAITCTLGVLNMYYNGPTPTAAVPAVYNSGGVTNVGTTPDLVAGQNLITATTICQAGGRSRAWPGTLSPSNSIGVDKVNDRIIALSFPAGPYTALAGTICVGLLIDRDQE